MNKFECEVDQTKLRSPKSNVMKTEGLFYEHASKLKAAPNFPIDPEPVYTLKDRPHKGLPSAYEIYMDSSTEYEAAMRIVGSWKHWKKLCRAKFFQVHVNEWREERVQMEEAMAHTVLLNTLEKDNITAAKSILESNKKNNKGAGRPTTQAVTGELKKAAEERSNLESIVNRMSSVK